MSDKETTDLDPRIPHDTWQWCAVHELPMVHYDPSGPPYCWHGMSDPGGVESCQEETPIEIHISEGFPRHLSYRWIDEKADMAAAFDALAEIVSSQTMKDVGYSGIATVLYAAFGLLDD